MGHIPNRISAALYYQVAEGPMTTRIVPAAYFTSEGEAAAFGAVLTALYQLKPGMLTLPAEVVR